MPRDITDRFPGFEKFTTYGIYYPTHTGISDMLTKSVLNLKNGDKHSIKRWANYIKKNFGFKIKNWILVRALGHKELRSSGDEPLDKLGKLLVESSDISQANHWLHKNRVTKALKFLNSNDRKKELNDVYSFPTNKDPEIRNKRFGFLIYDDIVTTGTTIKVIADAIKKSWPNARLRGFALLDTYDSHALQDGNNNAVYNKIFPQNIADTDNYDDMLVDNDKTMDAYEEWRKLNE